jgi:hypothetical protein
MSVDEHLTAAARLIWQAILELHLAQDRGADDAGQLADRLDELNADLATLRSKAARN